mmetsp:Transcript_119554/g.334849  ORF Transcript_119554/g.334849 Transcript_119554/m.334849 type:complete len:81 (+) Transcript_119554:695-937(+)
MLCLARALPHELNRVDKSGRTALHLAAACGYKDLCIALVRHPGFTTAHFKDKFGCTALDLATDDIQKVLEATPWCNKALR